VIRLRHHIHIDRKPDEVFALIDDPGRYPEFFLGVTQWSLRSKKPKGVGARYRVLMSVGSIQAGGTVEVTHRREPELIRWKSVQGVRQEGRWRLRPTDPGTELTLEIGFDLSGGPVGALVERLAGRTVERNMWATLLAARRLLEAEDDRPASAPALRSP
jgi:ribosome-associated toxin RatA of RatAB toxin-antitoxin module